MPKKFDKSPKAKDRRKRVIERLEKQLEIDADLTEPMLKEPDIKRIKKELEVLKTRI